MLATLPAWPFFAGVALGFLGCAIAGRLVSQRTLFHSFLRFHHSIELGDYFYPTASQLIAQVRNTLPPGKTPVIIGGASYLRGTGQNASELWSSELQRLLGEKYVVYNFAVDQADVTSFAAVVFEALAHEYPNLIYVANGSPLAGAPWDGGEIYNYLFWDAYYKGLLPPSITDSERMRSFARAQRRKPGQRELHLGQWLDQFTYACDWWTYVGHEFFFSVWSDAHAHRPLRPRREDRDDEVADYPEQQLRLRTDAAYAQHSETHGRGASRVGFTFAADGTSRPDPAFWDHVAGEWHDLFPAELRGRCFIVFLRGNPHFMQTFSADDRRRTELQYEIGQQMLEREGYRVVQLSAGEFTADDYLDGGHLMPSGGFKVARAVAVKIDAVERTDAARVPSTRPPSGALQVEFSLPATRPSTPEPLLTLGPPSGPATEMLFLDYGAEGRVRFGYQHEGDSVVHSPEVVLTSNAPHAIRLSLPGLYPDAAHAFEADLSQSQLQRLKSWLFLQLDGKAFWEVPLPERDNGAVPFQVGRAAQAGSPLAASFSGVIHKVERLPYPPKLFSRDRVGGARLRFTVAATMLGRAFPLATTGVNGSADVLFMRVGAEGRVTFGYDHWAAPVALSREISLGIEREHVIEFRLPALAANPSDQREVIISVDGAEIWRAVVPHFHAGAQNVFFGRNPIGATTAEPALEGGTFEAVLVPSRDG